MNKNELIAEYSSKNNVGKSDATKALVASDLPTLFFELYSAMSSFLFIPNLLSDSIS